MTDSSETDFDFKRSGRAVRQTSPLSEGLPGVTDRQGPHLRLRVIGLATVILALVSGIATFVILLGLTSIAPTDDVIQIAMIVNGTILVALALVIGWEASSIILARHKGKAGARLHIKVMGLFALVATVPTVLVAIFASITLDRGLDRWFSSRTMAIINSSQTVASAYTKEHARVLRNELLGIGAALNDAEPYFLLAEDRFRAIFARQTRIRGIPAAFIVSGDGQEMMASPSRLDQPLPRMPSKELLERARSEPELIALGDSNLVAGILRLDEFSDAYLFVVRVIDPVVSNFLRMTSENVQEYQAFFDSRSNIQAAFAMLYIGAGLIVLLSTTWFAIGFANTLVAPIRRLIGAAERVRHGDLFVRLPSEVGSSDFSNLNKTFNTMTTELRSQRDELILARDTMDARRRFTEAMLEGVSAGVLGIDELGQITLANPSAQKLLNMRERELLGKELTSVLPEIADLFETAEHSSGAHAEEQISVVRSGIELALRARITFESGDDDVHSYVVTLDDVTDLVSAQRSAAWADVARRIAHEIKNPLTPIQLSAERLRRRYGKKVAEEDRKVFDQCVNTIVRQVGDIGRMVDEFSSFARMPKPVFEPGDFSEVIKQSVFLIEVANHDVTFETDIPEEMPGSFDHRLLSQAMANIVKNATEAIAGREGLEDRKDEPGKVLVQATMEEESYCVRVVDNGIGFPVNNRQRLLEPYMTTREKGTGLGLAIVRKILHEHGGSIQLRDASEVSDFDHGACIEVRILKNAEASPEGANGEGEGNHNSGLSLEGLRKSGSE
ncbi:PAS domain-containing sensor histidine kinase [uncultured Cohaesibacter sp.]|uniref:sensor histidine kinase NtrY-like n=1 Tax=uncultured Cohaesibacter sp. TaxID=1002546 RepID=UPI0029C88500|nr:PAS domain-containing sensor histidine kinase [uncultured Cohaesibacter sp.]